MTYLKIHELKKFYLYKINGRNAYAGMWTGTHFITSRNKFGSTFLDKELHWDSDPHFGTAKPLEEIKRINPITRVNPTKLLTLLTKIDKQEDQKRKNALIHYLEKEGKVIT